MRRGGWEEGERRGGGLGEGGWSGLRGVPGHCAGYIVHIIQH